MQAFRHNYNGIAYVEAIDRVLNMSNISNTEYWYTYWRWIKIGLEGFFSYPVSSSCCFITIYQYFIGKYVELALLGVIISNFLNQE